MKVIILCLTFVSVVLATETEGSRPAQSTPKQYPVVAYDCVYNGAIHAIMDLRNIPECSRPELDYKEKETELVEIVQSSHLITVKAMVCNVRYSSEVGFCATIFHWSHGDKHTHFMEQVIWDRQTCLRAAMNGLITFKGKSFRVNLNSKEYFYYFKRGSISNAGSCTTDDFEVDGEEFKGAHQKIFLDAELKEISGKLNIATNEVHWENGLVTNYDKGWAEDSSIGFMAWEKIDLGVCEKTVSAVYTGKVDLYRKKKFVNSDTPNFDAMVLINHQHDQWRHAGFGLRENVKLCGRACHSTQLSDIFVCLIDDVQKKFPFNPDFDIESTNSKAHAHFLYLENRMNLQDNINDVFLSQCELERKTLKNKIDLVTSGNKRSLVDVFGKGYSVSVRGSWAYINKCKPFTTKVMTYPNCTVEIPINYLNQTFFSDPITNVIQKFPTIVPCDPIEPIAWQVENEWLCANPEIVKCAETPNQFNVTTKSLNLDFVNALHGGLFSEAQLEAHRKAEFAYNAREPVLARDANNAVQNSNAEMGTLGLEFDLTQMFDLYTYLSNKIHPYISAIDGFLTLLVVIAFIGGVIIAFFIQVKKMIVDIHENGFDAEKFTGWLFHLLTLGFCIPYEICKKVTEDVIEHAEDAMPKDLRDVEQGDVEKESIYIELKEDDASTVNYYVQDENVPFPNRAPSPSISNM